MACFWKTVLVTGLSLSFVACGQSRTTEQTKLVLTGSSTVAPLVNELGKKFEAANPGIRVDVQTGGSSRGFSDATVGLNDLGMVSRDLKPEEKTEFQDWAIAKDGLAMIVHADNPIDALNNEEVAAIFLDGENNWQGLGGNDGKITVVNKAEGRSTLELFLDHFELDNGSIQADVVIGDNQQGIKTVAGNPNAIGYVSIGAAEQEIAAGTPIKLLAMDGVVASTENVQNGSFPLARTLNLVSQDQPSELAQDFIEFARSPQAYDVVKAQSLVPLDVHTAQSQTKQPQS
ncbi:phosphate ABC transporter substrate-binding protein [[Limnothrix rosea] IAM M-220]|uniref:phosphate ABC transporter substrate-binding protein n=1 Tax=[Limnothrix rosea] IAM M-220 TaxID=454133 RepID=UPI0009687807|nr:phosphate ABC transporter substrate-binding protein [[Limnothrix rosea] IAM M-220]OKH19798.1 ABC transporter substrate-binding protein [[Limnothrix rosea] IAM M-220]